MGSAPSTVKFLLTSGALASNILFSLAFNHLVVFETTITDTVANALDGNALNIVKGTFGWGVVAL